MWINSEMTKAVDQVARVFYIGVDQTTKWNENRRAGEPRLLTGWVWSARSGTQEQHGIKTMTAAYIDAWYHLVARQAPPRIGRRPTLRVVTNERRVA
jgi:hypothetical protein